MLQNAENLKMLENVVLQLDLCLDYVENYKANTYKYEYYDVQINYEDLNFLAEIIKEYCLKYKLPLRNIDIDGFRWGEMSIVLKYENTYYIVYKGNLNDLKTVVCKYKLDPGKFYIDYESLIKDKPIENYKKVLEETIQEKIQTYEWLNEKGLDLLGIKVEVIVNGER